MIKLRFEWDPDKAASNLRKHRIAFQEAATVFGDPFSWTFPDREHSDDEPRWVTLGASGKGSVLVIAHTETGDTLRIISARKATARERRFYEEKQPS
jgi:hypothetical protein